MNKKSNSLRYTDMRALALHAKSCFPDTGFFLCDDERMPYVTGSELYSFCTNAAGVLDGYPAQHIAIIGPGSAAWITSYFSVISAGRVIVPLHDGMQKQELEECIRQAECGVLIYDKRRARTAESIREAITGLQIIEMHDFLDRIRETKGAPSHYSYLMR